MTSRSLVSSILAQDGGGLDPTFLIMMGVMFFIMYMLVFRPQRKQEKARKAMIAAVKKNDRILTSGGVIGTVTNTRDADVTIRIDDDKNVRIRINRNFINSVLDRDDEGKRSSEA